MLIAVIVIAAAAPLAAAFAILAWGGVLRQNPAAGARIRGVALGLALGVLLGVAVSTTLLAAVLGLRHLRGG